jgi:hypothetical protein
MRLILTTNVSTSRDLEESGRADIAIPLMPRFVWGALPTDTELVAIFAPRTTQSPGSHWLDYAFPLAKKMFGRDIGLIELCQCCEAVELWMETEPNGQLVLVWLLDYLHSHANATIGSNLILCHVDANLGGALPTELVKWRFRAVGITSDHLETGSLAWKAYRAPTPQAWFNLLEKDLSVLPQLDGAFSNCSTNFQGAQPGLVPPKCGSWN